MARKGVVERAIECPSMWPMDLQNEKERHSSRLVGFLRVMLSSFRPFETILSHLLSSLTTTT